MGITNLDTLALSGDLSVAGNATVTGTLTAAGIIGSVSEISAKIATADDGTTQTLTAGMVTGSPVFVVHTSAGGTTPSLTMPLATAIIAANTGWVVGDSYTLRVINTNSGTATIVTNTGITTSGTLTIAAGGQADFVIAMTAAATVTMTRANQTSAVTLDAVQTMTNKTFTTPVIGVATATSVNKVAITAPATSATLTIPDGVTLTGPAVSGTAATLAGMETLTNKTLTSPTINNATISGTISANVVTSTPQLDATSNTALANIGGLVQTVVPGTYKFVINLSGTSGASGGWKVAFKYTATVLSSIEVVSYAYTASAVAVAHTTTATDQASLIAATTAYISGVIEGTMVVTTGGTVQLQFAQNASNGTASSIYVGSTMQFIRTA